MSLDDGAASRIDPALLEAFQLPGERRPACLLIHGFTGTPYEVRRLGETLSASGHAALGVRLAGHGRTPEQLEQTRWTDWYRDVDDACTRLTASGDPIVVIGISAGALLALHLAHERSQDVRGLALMAAAIRLRAWPARCVLPIIARLPLLWKHYRFIPKRTDSDIRDPSARYIHPGYRRIPLAAAVTLLHLQQRVRREIASVTQPTLLIHGARDRTCPVSNTTLLAKRLATPPRRVLILEDSAHVVTVDQEHERVETAVLEFVSELSPPGTGQDHT